MSYIKQHGVTSGLSAGGCRDLLSSGESFHRYNSNAPVVYHYIILAEYNCLWFPMQTHHDVLLRRLVTSHPFQSVGCVSRFSLNWPSYPLRKHWLRGSETFTRRKNLWKHLTHWWPTLFVTIDDVKKHTQVGAFDTSTSPIQRFIKVCPYMIWYSAKGPNKLQKFPLTPIIWWICDIGLRFSCCIT